MYFCIHKIISTYKFSRTLRGSRTCKFSRTCKREGFSPQSKNPNTMSEQYKVFDDACLAPPPPYDPCKELGDWAVTAAEEVCDTLKGK